MRCLAAPLPPPKQRLNKLNARTQHLENLFHHCGRRIAGYLVTTLGPEGCSFRISVEVQASRFPSMGRPAT
jgi:hypothetical protein